MPMETSAASYGSGGGHTAVHVGAPAGPAPPSKRQLVLDAIWDILAIGACLAVTLVLEGVTPVGCN